MPDAEDIDANIDAFLNELKMKFGFDTEFFEKLFDGEMTVQDTYVDYNVPGVGEFTFKVFDTSYMIQGITYFRPFIRGFIVLLLAVYHIKNVLGFIRQDAGVAVGKGADIDAGEQNHYKKR